MKDTYLDNILDPQKLNNLVNRVLVNIKYLKRKLNFDAIATTGLSGVSILSIVSYKTKIPPIYIRKSKAHGKSVESLSIFKKYIILDDFIVTGQTIKNISRSIDKNFSKKECAGIVLYDEGAKKSGKKFKESIKIPIYYIF